MLNKMDAIKYQQKSNETKKQIDFEQTRSNNSSLRMKLKFKYPYIDH